jgi:hypothetical protein
LQLSLEEDDILYLLRIPMPLQFKLPRGWHISNAGYVVSPPPGPEMHALIAERRSHMTPTEQSRPDNA